MIPAQGLEIDGLSHSNPMGSKPNCSTLSSLFAVRSESKYRPDPQKKQETPDAQPLTLFECGWQLSRLNRYERPFAILKSRPCDPLLPRALDLGQFCGDDVIGPIPVKLLFL